MEEKTDLYILHATLGLGGGVGTVIKNLIEYQISQGYSVGLCYSKLNNAVDFPNISYKGNELDLFEYDPPPIISKIRGYNLLFGIPLQKVFIKVKEKNPDKAIVMHVHNPVGIGILNSCRLNEMPIICTLHGLGSNQFTIRIAVKFILKRLYKCGKPIVAVSNNTANVFNKLLNMEYITTIHNGVKINKLNRIKKNDIFTIGYASYIDSLKGWRELLTAFNLLMPEYRGKIKLVMAGSGPNTEVEAMLTVIEKLNLENDVEFKGYVPNAGDTLIPYFDIFVLPSEKEGLPMSILEALSHGVPVIATAVGGIPEIIKNRVNGLLLLNRNPECIKDGLLELLENPELYTELSNNSLDIYDKKFNMKIMVEEYIAIYKTVVSLKN